MKLRRRYWNSSHYLLHCSYDLQERKTLLNTVSYVVPNVSDFHNAQLTEIFLYGNEDLDNINNTSILDVTINYSIETKRFDARLFWYSPDSMALTWILILKFMFLFFFLFCFCYDYSFIIFRLILNILYAYFFVPRYMTTYICITGDCNFIRLIEKKITDIFKQIYTIHKMNFSIESFFSKCDQTTGKSGFGHI